MRYKYKLSALGGTFDRFHNGHKKLIDSAFIQSEKVIIGIVTNKLFKDKSYSHIIESFKIRRKNVENYLESEESLNRIEIVEINDIYGPTVRKKNIEAIYATEGNLENIEKINIKRKSNGFKPLEAVIISYSLGDDSQIITSERIRLGEIDRDGNSYFGLFAKKKRYILPEDMRPKFKNPIGIVVKNAKQIVKLIDKRNMLIAAGDIAAINSFQIGLQAGVSIIDYKTRRLNIDDSNKKVLTDLQSSSDTLVAENQAGAIERRAVGVIKKAISAFLETNKKQVVLIDGEEDLMVMPSILLSPLESVVTYGQPDKGLVVVKVTEKKKKEIINILSRMS